MKCKGLYVLLACFPGIFSSVQADELVVAVAANFASTLEELAYQFEEHTGHEVTVVSGATGRLYAQIVNGAPYDLFFSADAEAPRLLEEEGRAVAGTRVVYASGRLALWSRQSDVVDNEGRVLAQGQFRRLAIANPRLAPYGEAAMEVLNGLGLGVTLEERLVRGENIAQTYQFADTGNAELAFVAYSQVLEAGQHGSWWLVPDSLHQPLRQEAILVRASAPGQEFLDFVMTDTAQILIRNSGYASAAVVPSLD